MKNIYNGHGLAKGPPLFVGQWIFSANSTKAHILYPPSSFEPVTS